MDAERIISELTFKAVRSSGSGGQNVNKVSSKVVLSFNVFTSQSLSEEEKTRITEKLKTKLTSDGILLLNCDEDRSQLKNKEIVAKRFLKLIQNALVIPKERKATKIPRAVIEKRIKEKRTISEIKQNRKRPDV